MKDPVRFLDDIQTSFKKMKYLTVAALVFAAVVSLCSVYLAFSFVNQKDNTIFVADEGYVTAARRQTDAVQRDMEINVHVRRFHELMYNLAPDATTIRNRVEQASALGVNCAMELDRTRTEQQFYTQMIQLGAVLEINIESVEVDMSNYPYIAKTNGKLYFIRSSNVAEYEFESLSQLVNTPRSPTNPNGFSIEKFTVLKQEQIRTTKRNYLCLKRVLQR